MFLGIQILGIVFIAIMLYFTYLNYKRHNYGSRSFISWLVVWLAGLLVVLFPHTLYTLMDAVNIDRTYDLFYIGAFVILFVIVFNMYVTIKKTHAKVEELVRERAIETPITKKKTKK